MTLYKITIEYDGTNYCGWQAQDDAPSIQQAVQEAIQKFSGQETKIYCAGRTDAGVHAWGQVAHFELSGDQHPTETICNAINFYLIPQPISIISCEKMNDDFHARFFAKKRYYTYIILNRYAAPAIERNRVWHLRKELDIPAMQTAAEHLIGHHDFSSFRSSHCQAKSPMKTIDAIDISQSGNHIFLNIKAKSFLHNMVRIIVGTLQLVAAGKIAPLDVKKILDAKDRKKAGITAPACGLYFRKVDY